MMNQNIDKEALFLKAVSVERDEFKELFTYLKQDFGYGERIPFYIMQSAFKKGIVRAVYLTDGFQVYGYAIYQHEPAQDCVHVFYLAILSDYRSLGLGSTLLARLKTLSNGRILLEVEDPDKTKKADKVSIRIRRINFYERNGFHLSPDINLKSFGYPLRLMTLQELPKVDQKEFQKYYQSLYNRVYQFPIGKLMVKAR